MPINSPSKLNSSAPCTSRPVPGPECESGKYKHTKTSNVSTKKSACELDACAQTNTKQQQLKVLLGLNTSDQNKYKVIEIDQKWDDNTKHILIEIQKCYSRVMRTNYTQINSDTYKYMYI